MVRRRQWLDGLDGLEKAAIPEYHSSVMPFEMSFILLSPLSVLNLS